MSFSFILIITGLYLLFKDKNDDANKDHHEISIPVIAVTIKTKNRGVLTLALAIIILLWLFNYGPCVKAEPNAEENYVHYDIRGMVTDATSEDARAISNVEIREEGDSDNTTRTDENGNFTLLTRNKHTKLVITKDGYESCVRDCEMPQLNVQYIELNPKHEK